MEDRRFKVRAALQQRGIPLRHSSEEEAAAWALERFVIRARALFTARLMFLSVGLLVLAVPVWRRHFGLTPLAFGGYFFVLLYSVANSLSLEHAKAGRWVTYVTLCCDLLVMVIAVQGTGASAGLQNPLLATQLVFTTLFALLFPRPLAVLPPLLALPIIARLDILLDHSPTAVELLTLFWYLGLNLIIIYVLVSLNEREVASHNEVVELQGDLREFAVLEERTRLAREIHDGLGAGLSSMIIQAEYLLQLTQEPALRREIGELKASAEEAIDELRRSLVMMRDDFDLGTGLGEYVRTFRERTQLDVSFEQSGTMVGRLRPETSLALFRVLQECLTNAAKHARCAHVFVRIHFSPTHVHLSVKDDGQGFDAETLKAGHYGLVNIRERALQIGGEVSVESTPGSGTHVQLSIPLASVAD